VKIGIFAKKPLVVSLMACIDAQGNITRSAELILLSMMKPVSLEEAAAQSNLPLFRIRSAIRELGKAGFITKADNNFQTTSKGIRAIEGRKK
jgi:predicted transcriptional regulator